MALPPKPTITPPPAELPTRGENPTDFSNKINDLVQWYPDLTDNLSDSVDWIEDSYDETVAVFNATEQERIDAQTARTGAETAQGLAEDARDAAQLAETGAEAFKDTAEAAAAAAQSAAGLPAITGKTGSVLTVVGGSGSEAVSFEPGENVGRVVYSYEDLTDPAYNDAYVATGQTYLQSEYPELFGLLGLGKGEWPGDKLPNPADLPASTGNAVAFSSDGTYMAVAHPTTPFITIYKRSGDTFTKLADPSSLPASTGQGVAFSSDGTYMAVAHSTTPFITIYKQDYPFDTSTEFGVGLIESITPDPIGGWTQGKLAIPYLRAK
jgi:hypothetical protein